jgi:hypothetical protein
MLLYSGFKRMLKLTPEKSTGGGKPLDNLEIGIPHLSFFHPEIKEELDAQIVRTVLVSNVQQS